jgi:mRNA-degrading endonuclease YafQ of YafQ-DinJ toxin-antitoxin module
MIYEGLVIGYYKNALSRIGKHDRPKLPAIGQRPALMLRRKPYPTAAGYHIPNASHEDARTQLESRTRRPETRLPKRPERMRVRRRRRTKKRWYANLSVITEVRQEHFRIKKVVRKVGIRVLAALPKDECFRTHVLDSDFRDCHVVSDCYIKA